MRSPILVVAVEWGPISIFYNRGQTLERRDVSDLTGWWSALVVADAMATDARTSSPETTDSTPAIRN